MENEALEKSKEQGFEEVPSDSPEAIQMVDGETTFKLNEKDYAVICRGNGIIEQVIPTRVQKDGCVENDMQAFFLYCALIWTSVEENEDSKAIVQQVFAHAENMDGDDDGQEKEG